MNKFENIEVGDVVIVNETIVPGMWEKKIYFFVAKPVEKVTPKQFMVCGSMYRKSDGAMVKSGNGRIRSRAYKEGEQLNRNSLVTDQTKERNECVRNANTANRCKPKLTNIKEGLKYNTPNLKKIAEKIDEIELLMKK